MRAVTEQDFRKPEFAGARVEDYELRGDGVPVRKDRWESGMRTIVGVLGLDRGKFEVIEVINEVQRLHLLANPTGYCTVGLCCEWTGPLSDCPGKTPATHYTCPDCGGRVLPDKI